jgi:lysozyme
MPTYSYSDHGLALTRSFEGLSLKSYQDSGGVWTIGYGHTGPGVHAGLSITPDRADNLLREDVAAAVGCVNRGVRVPLAQHQFDALVDFCFNAGSGNFLGSTLLRAVNAGEFAAATEQFALWVHAAGAVIPGLVRRRAAEAALFSGNTQSAGEGA